MGDVTRCSGSVRSRRRIWRGRGDAAGLPAAGRSFRPVSDALEPFVAFRIGPENPSGAWRVGCWKSERVAPIAAARSVVLPATGHRGKARPSKPGAGKRPHREPQSKFIGAFPAQRPDLPGLGGRIRPNSDRNVRMCRDASEIPVQGGTRRYSPSFQPIRSIYAR